MEDRAAFLAERREALLAAMRRVFFGSQEIIPSVAPAPGTKQPCPITRPASPQPCRKPSSSPGGHGNRRKSAGNIPAGTVVPTYFGNGRVLGFVPAGEDPMALIPPGTPVWQLSGGRTHDPSLIPRYVVHATRNQKDWFLFEKALTLEKRLEGANHG